MDDEFYNLLGLKVILYAAAPKKGILEIVDTANNGLEALKAVQGTLTEGKNNQYGLIIMDCSMPIMDGYDAATQIRKFLSLNF